ncbi:RHS repeat-associated core domain-containing protein [Phaeodactylibacter sp.]|uniref:RHS repeat-associated core domain-containing protein n=1 Tax=Phaeodactylibacter sp. TaxID=1940289 RepID=UPI0025DB0256|nr:RHS repeat-associated core domain-containing protein [Phaeodactylibacter sp.]
MQAAYSTVAPDNDYRYNGKELNGDYGIGLHDYGARWYDAAIGRFTTTDPVAESYSFQTAYAYAANNPVSNIDYMGMAAESVLDLVQQAWDSTPEDGSSKFDNDGKKIIDNEENNDTEDCCPDPPSDILYQTIWTPIEDFVGNYLLLPLIPNSYEVKGIRKMALERGLDLSGFTDKEVLANITLRKVGGELVLSSNVAFMTKLVRFGFDALFVSAIFMRGGGAGALMAKGGLPGFKMITSNARADELARKAGFINAHHFKDTYKTSGKTAHWNMLFNHKTKELGIIYRGSGIELPTGAYAK